MENFSPSLWKSFHAVKCFSTCTSTCLTATATVALKKNITESLGLCDPQVIAVYPDRQNIFFSSFLRKASGDDKLVEILQPLVKELRRERKDFPLTLIYGNLDTIAECYTYFSQSLGVEQYSEQNGEKSARNRLFTQFHAQYPEHERQRIVSELANRKSKFRILFVTASFGIGIGLMQDIEASQQALSLQESPVPSRSLDFRARSLSDNTKEKLHNALVDYRLSLHGSGPSCVGGLDLATGFSIELIDMIVEKTPQLHSLEDIKDNLPIFSNEHT